MSELIFRTNGSEQPEWPERGSERVINRDILRVETPLKVTGRARYTHDIRLPGMVYARVLLCPYPSAAFTLDLEPARRLPGVVLAVPWERGLREGRTVYLGQPIAAVVAETPELAEDALHAIAVRYRDCDQRHWVVDYEQSTAPVAPRVSQRQENVCRRSERGERATAEAALERCDAVVEATFTLPVQHHACLETHGVVVDFRGGEEATIYLSGQHANAAQGDTAAALGLPENKIDVVIEHMGGGFGSKFPLDITGVIACTLARQVARPVHLMLPRDQEFYTTGNRSGSRQVLKGGATRDGRFVTLLSELFKLGGLGRGSNPGQPYVYTPEHSHCINQSVLTNTDSSRPMRAPGHPQASFAIEGLVDELAYAVGFDLLEFRKKNLPGETYARQLERCAREIGWFEHPKRTRPGTPDEELAVGIGFGVSTWGGGGRPVCKVRLRIARDGSVTAFSGTQDLGTGTRTLVAAIVAEELGLAVEQVEARIGRRSYGPANASGGSTTAASLSPAVKHAAHQAREQLCAHLAPLMDCEPGELALAGGKVAVRGEAAAALPWKQACATLPEAGLETLGEFQPHLQASGVQGAQAVKVQIDTLTGEIAVQKIVSVHNAGLPINRLAFRSQLNGGMIQALSYGLFEERVIDPELGVLLSASFDTYKIAGCEEIPEMVAIIDDEDGRGVIGIGEPPAIPGHGALANAIHNACGARLRDMPLSPARLIVELERLRTAGAKEEGR